MSNRSSLEMVHVSSMRCDSFNSILQHNLSLSPHPPFSKPAALCGFVGNQRGQHNLWPNLGFGWFFYCNLQSAITAAMKDGGWKKASERERERESNFLWWKTNGWNAGLNEQKRIPFFHLLVGVILLPGPGRPVAWLDFNLSFYPPTTRHNGCHDSVQCGGWCFER